MSDSTPHPTDLHTGLSMAAMELSTVAHKIQFVTGMDCGHACEIASCPVHNFTATEVCDLIAEAQRLLRSMVTVLCDHHEIDLSDLFKGGGS